MHECPKCKSDDFHRSRVKSKWEYLRKELTGRRPYRCHACGWRGWGVDLGPKFGDEELAAAARALAPEPPNLEGTALAREKTRAELSLDQLESFDALDNKRK